ncbi:stage II sporulation protein D [Cohnella kolymensis]|uniref:stage II sporulation protein D n=1 Tax=Cohnella kolymensis TaxID=1590652 RepID=UPI0006981509|nr:stage II sporulation protein D [Cohnella kolymensis]
MDRKQNEKWLTGTSSKATLNLWLAFSMGVAFAVLSWLHLHSDNGAQADLVSQGVFEDNEGSQGTKNIETVDNVAGPLDADGAPTLGAKGADEADSEPRINIRVYLMEDKRVESVQLETYVAGVVAAEMPVDFEPAALEAQALAARTYIVRKLWLNDKSGVPVPGADVTDTQTHQVYRSSSEMKRLAAIDQAGWRKVQKAVKDTAGQVISYRGEPIEALFFSTSNGYTENSEEVFPAKLPYLRSVASPWDKEGSPRAAETVEMPLTDFYQKLGVRSLSAGAGVIRQPTIRIVERTAGHRVKLLSAGGTILTGEQVRNKLGLRSASFEWVVRKDKVVMTVFGSGHGVGMSQWGAQGMAQAGMSARQIVQHYYTGTLIEKVSKLLNRSGKRL